MTTIILLCLLASGIAIVVLNKRVEKLRERLRGLECRDSSGLRWLVDSYNESLERRVRALEERNARP